MPGVQNHSLPRRPHELGSQFRAPPGLEQLSSGLVTFPVGSVSKQVCGNCSHRGGILTGRNAAIEPQEHQIEF